LTGKCRDNGRYTGDDRPSAYCLEPFKLDRGGFGVFFKQWLVAVMRRASLRVAAWPMSGAPGRFLEIARTG
jgi:hypothetical protein